MPLSPFPPAWTKLFPAWFHPPQPTCWPCWLLFLFRILSSSMTHLLPTAFLRLQSPHLLCFWPCLYLLPSLAQARQQSVHMCLYTFVCMCTSLPAQRKGKDLRSKSPFILTKGLVREQGPVAGGLVALSHIWGWRASYPGSVHWAMLLICWRRDIEEGLGWGVSGNHMALLWLQSLPKPSNWS